MPDFTSHHHLFHHTDPSHLHFLPRFLPGLPAFALPFLLCNLLNTLSSFHFPYWKYAKCHVYCFFHERQPFLTNGTTPVAVPECPGEAGTAQEPSAQVPLGSLSISVCLFLRALSESTLCQMTPACRPLPGSFGNYLTASRRNARLGFTLFEG